MIPRARQGVFLAVLSLVSAGARAVEPTLIADTHVNLALPAINSGTVSNIAVGAGYTGLLQFDLSTLPTGTTAAQISKATLRLYVNRVDTAGSVSVLPLTAAWSEYGVTYTSLPATGASIGTLAVAQTGTFVTLDITAQVKAWLTTPTANNGLALTAASAAVQFDSKENDLTAHPATLDVSLTSQGATGATGPAGPQGIAGAQGPAGANGPQGLPGAAGAPGPAGANGAVGPAGPAGLTGAIGPAGPTGAAGPQGVKGLPGVGIQGPYASATNYGINDVVTWQGSSWYSLVAGNHGNTPDQSPAYWAVLAAAGVGLPGAAGPAGATGPPGLTGPQGASGVAGPQGPTGIQGLHGLPGLVYQGAYASATNYALGDVVLWQGASWSSLVDGNHGNTPSFSPAYWGVLTAQGPTGATGATGLPGPTGAIGALGPVGPPGERGDQGLQGIAGQVGLAFQGTYSSSQNYALADGVIYKGAGYVSLQASNHGNAPDQSPAAWSLFATGTPGATGAVGAPGATGATGPQGQQGFPGAAGPQGPIGPQGPATVTYTGNYSSASNYGLNDAVAYAGSTYVSMVAGNHGNTPGLSPTYWSLLVAKGDAGAAGPSGPVGAAGPAGTTGPIGLTGAQGPPVNFLGAWSATRAYSVGDAVSYAGSSYIALAASTGRQPDQSTASWAVLAAVGAQGPVGAQGLQGPAGQAGDRGAQGLQGIAGQAGAQGIPGAMGAQGLSGPAGPQGMVGPVGLTFQGTYSASQNYALGDGVLYNGAGYASLIANNHGNTPDQTPSAWSLFATGTPGAVGPAGASGPAGAAGPQGQPGAAGAAGAQGPVGPQGPAAVVYTGNYSAATSYNLNDAAAYAGSTYVSMLANNHGNTPGQSPAYWTVLVAKGDAGAAGPAGAAGAAGAAGSAGPAGAAGAQGPPVTFVGGWSAARSYSVGDAVSYAGSSYIALVANAGRQPDVSPASWGLLAATGAQGPVGASGAQGLQGPTGYAGPAGPAGATGAAGPQGPAGGAGATGPAGPQGVAGPQGATGVAGLAYRGAYASATSYGLNDAVIFAGSSYVSLSPSNAGNTPDSSPAYWGLLAAQGAAGATGAAGSNGANGAAGAQGVAGATGPQGPAGAAGANGAAGLTYQGAWSSAANYALNDAVTYNGSSYISLAAANHGNAPAASPASWAVLAQMGAAGAAGAAGTAGAQGPAGVQGPQGATGAQGSAGAVGVNFRGAWVTGSGYAANDAVTYQGATWLAQVSNASVAPGSNASVWAVLAAAGSAGPTGAAGTAASVAVGTVTTGAAGSAASVTNSGSALAAVLNFTLPQGAAGASGSGGGGGAGTSGIPYAAMYHSVSYAATYYSVNNTNQSASETASVLTWVPQGCSATRLDVFSQQGATITVTLRVGTPGAMVDSALSCAVGTGKSCSAAGAVAVAAGQFVDVGITHSDSNPVGVWTAVSCN